MRKKMKTREKIRNKSKIEELENKLNNATVQMRTYERHVEWWCLACIGGVIVGFLVWTILWYGTVNVDEGKFCLEKLKAYYPEYNWQSAGYESDLGICVGQYYEMPDTRDGLSEFNGSITKSFIVNNDKDKNHLARDDTAGFMVCLGVFASIAFVVWLGARFEE